MTQEEMRKLKPGDKVIWKCADHYPIWAYLLERLRIKQEVNGGYLRIGFIGPDYVCFREEGIPKIHFSQIELWTKKKLEPKSKVKDCINFIID
jgi:hypothetical protein